MSEAKLLENCKVVRFPAPEGDPREIVMDYMLKMANVEWKVKEGFATTWKTPGDFKVNLEYEADTVYRGIPYSRANGSLAEFEEFWKDGIFEVNSPYYEEIVGVHCSSSINRAYQQLIDLPFRGTLRPVSARGTIFEFVNGLKRPTEFGDDYDSFDVWNANSKNDVMEAFANVHRGDVLYYKNKKRSGHTRLVSDDSIVVRDPETGLIDPEQSFVITTEQTNAWDKTRTDGVKTTWWIDHRYSFAILYEKAFMPITLTLYTSGEKLKDAYLIWNGKNTEEGLKENKLTGTFYSNFPITYAKASVYDESGKCVTYGFIYALGGNYEVNMENANGFDVKSLPSGKYTFELRAAIARGGETFEKFEFTK